MTSDVESTGPRGVLGLADAVRLLGVLSVVVAAVWFGAVEVALFLLVLLGLLLPRVLAVLPGFDLALSATLLAAGWIAVLDLYAAVGPLDLVVHLVANGLLAVLACVLLVRARIAPDPDAFATTRHRVGVVLATTSVGIVLGLLWELGEWAGHTFLDDGINVGYSDTLGDLVAGGLGSFVGGVVLAARVGSVWAGGAARPAPHEVRDDRPLSSEATGRVPDGDR